MQAVCATRTMANAKFKPRQDEDPEIRVVSYDRRAVEARRAALQRDREAKTAQLAQLDAKSADDRVAALPKGIKAQDCYVEANAYVKTGRTPLETASAVARHFNLYLRDLAAERRDRPLVSVRQAAIAIVTDRHPGISRSRVGSIFGGRDHTTVLNALARVHSGRARR